MDDSGALPQETCCIQSPQGIIMHVFPFWLAIVADTSPGIEIQCIDILGSILPVNTFSKCLYFQLLMTLCAWHYVASCMNMNRL